MTPDPRHNQTFGRAIGLSAAVMVLGVIVSGYYRLVIAAVPADTAALHISFYKFGAQDFLWFAMAVVILPVTWVLPRSFAPRADMFTGKPWRMPVALISAGVFVLVWVGRFQIYHDHAISMDEFMLRFQLTVLNEGQLLAPVDPEWFELRRALRPGFLIFDPIHSFWAPGYRPGTSFLFWAAGLLWAEALLLPAICAGSVWLTAAIFDRLMPDTNGGPLMAAVMLALSTQFIVTGMTPYTMTAHLFASLFWVYLFTQDKPLGHALAIATGILAIGLHHVHVHSFFVLPFLLNLLFVQRRFALSMLYLVTYSAAGLGWIFWMDIAILLQGLTPVAQTMTASTGGGPAPVAEINGATGFILMSLRNGMAQHGWFDLAHWLINLLRLVAWQGLAFLPLLFVALRFWRDMPPAFRLLAWACVTSVLPYLILMPSQGHGWGYRYLHHGLGAMMILCAFGWVSIARIAQGDGAGRFRLAVLLMALASAAVLMPLRLVQTENFVRPWAKAQAHLAAAEADILLIEPNLLWYGHDLVRNDPYLRNQPVIISLPDMTDAQLARICQNFTTQFVDAADLVRLGLSYRHPNPAMRAELQARATQRLSQANCPT